MPKLSEPRKRPPSNGSRKPKLTAKVQNEDHDPGRVDLAPHKPQRRRRYTMATSVASAAQTEALVLSFARAPRLSWEMGGIERSAAKAAGLGLGFQKKLKIEASKTLEKSRVSK